MEEPAENYINLNTSFMSDYSNFTLDDFQNQIIKFRNDVISRHLENYYGTKSLGEIFGVSRKELAHSKFLAWLLSNQESHNLGNYPFKKFLEILVLSPMNTKSKAQKELFDSIGVNVIT